MNVFWLNLWELMLELAPWLFVGTAMASLLHLWVPRDLISRRLGGGGIGEVARAVGFGVPLPLCSCGVIPVAISLKKEGASEGASIGFMISTPQTGIDSIFVTASMLGWPFAVFKVGAALVTGLVGGVLVERMKPEVQAKEESRLDHHDHNVRGTWREGLRYGVHELIYPIWGWLTVGMFVSAAVTTWIPQDQFASLAAGGVWTLLLMVAVSTPLYVCATASVPVAASLVLSGFPEGAALVFLMAGPATNVATIGAVYRVFGVRVMWIYLLTVFVGSIGFGMVFDIVWGLSASNLPVTHGHDSVLTIASTILLTFLLGWFAVKDLRGIFRVRRPRDGQQTVELTVSGLTCGGCVSKLSSRLRALSGVETVDVVLESGRTHVYGVDLNRGVIENAVREVGFSV